MCVIISSTLIEKTRRTCDSSKQGSCFFGRHCFRTFDSLLRCTTLCQLGAHVTFEGSFQFNHKLKIVIFLALLWKMLANIGLFKNVSQKLLAKNRGFFINIFKDFRTKTTKSKIVDSFKELRVFLKYFQGLINQELRIF